MEDLNNTNNQLDLTDSQRTLQPKPAVLHSLQVYMKQSPKEIDPGMQGMIALR